MRALARVAVAGIAAVLVGCPPRVRQLDLNSASATQLETLPGVGPDLARRIVADRPYTSKDDLLRRRVVTREEYDDIASGLYVGPPGTPDYLRSVPPTPDAP